MFHEAKVCILPLTKACQRHGRVGTAETVKGLDSALGISTDMRIDAAIVRSPLKEKGTEWNCNVITEEGGQASLPCGC